MMLIFICLLLCNILSCSHLLVWMLKPKIMMMNSVILGMPHRNQDNSTFSQLTKTCVGLWLSVHSTILSCHPSIYPPGHSRQTWATIMLNLSQWAPLPNLSLGPVRACSVTNLIPVVDKVKRAGAVPSVSIMGQQCNNTVMFLW